MRNGAIWALVALALAGATLPARAEPGSIENGGMHHPSSLGGLQLANWTVATGDNGDMPFIVIDKVAAEVLVFDAQGLLQGTTPALLGIAHGDDATPGVGDRELNEIGPAEKTTPAGRFLARIGPAKGGKTVLWVDFADSVALHAVVTSNKAERRLARLKSPTPEDNRITFGCINVPAAFFKGLVHPLFADKGGVVYILPEKRELAELFPAFYMFMPRPPQSPLRPVEAP
jgi:hypothetical protein